MADGITFGWMSQHWIDRERALDRMEYEAAIERDRAARREAERLEQEAALRAVQQARGDA